MTKRMSTAEENRARTLRDRAFLHQGGLCFWCGERMRTDVDQAHPRRLTGDHITPISAGGETTSWNIVAACFECNQKRADSGLAAFTQVLEEQRSDYSMTKSEFDDYIKMLAMKYPGCFLVESRHRRPLKHGIATDLAERERWPAEKAEAIIAYYEGAWAYQHQVTAGTPRLDLDGKIISRVTEKESITAARRVISEKQHIYARKPATLPAPVVPPVVQRQVVVPVRPEIAMKAALSMLAKAKAGLGEALVDGATQMRADYFDGEAAILFGPLGSEIEEVLAHMERLGSALQAKPETQAINMQAAE
jgi:hypothetical protein